MNCFVIPIIVGATGTVTKGLQKYLEKIPGNHSIHSLKKICTKFIAHKESATLWNLKPECRSTWERKPLLRDDDDDDDDDDDEIKVKGEFVPVL
jgi:hypothetical protein